MKMYQQGCLDRLCGLYSLVNAVRQLKSLDEEKCQSLFKVMVTMLEKDESLAGILTGGMYFKDISRLASTVLSDYGIKRSVPFHKSEPNLNEFWSSCVEFLERGNCCILLGISGDIDHWTLAVKATDEMITLVDSTGLENLEQSACTVGEPHGNRMNVIWPKQTYFLEVSEEEG